ncbi:MAG: Na+/H+ antiporter subunit E [Chloroflexota bacterium]
MKNARRPSAYTVLFILVFAFWMALSPSLSTLNLILGILSSGLVVLITRNILDTDFARAFTLPVLYRVPDFALAMLWEIIKANIDVALIVINPELPIEPSIFRYRCHLRGDLEKTVFAYCVNLTPGTVVIDIQDDVYFVHALARRHAAGLSEGQLEKMVARLFGHDREQVTSTERA